MGLIRREVARMARAFDMQVQYRDQARLPAELEQGSIFHDSDESFLPGCEVLSLNGPGGESTYHWLNAERICSAAEGCRGRERRARRIGGRCRIDRGVAVRPGELRGLDA